MSSLANLLMSPRESQLNEDSVSIVFRSNTQVTDNYLQDN